MVYRSQYVFMDANTLVKIIYTVAKARDLGKKPIMQILLEQGAFVIYTSRYIIDEVERKALWNLTRERERHGWRVSEAEAYRRCIEVLDDAKERGWVRVIEEDPSLARQREALEHRPTRRVCTRAEVLNKIVRDLTGTGMENDIQVLMDLLTAYDLLATVPRRTEAGITTGVLWFLSEDKELVSYIRSKLTCSNCPCKDYIMIATYKEFKDGLKSII